MSDVDSDEELNRAIALSLQQSSPPATKSTGKFIDLVSDEDDEDDLDAPMVVRGISSPAKPNRKADTKLNEPDTVDLTQDEQHKKDPLQSRAVAVGSPIFDQFAPVSVESQRGGILGLLNRKQMEEERLARARQKSQQMEAGNFSRTQESKKRKASRSPESSDREGRTATAGPSRTSSIFKKQQQPCIVPTVRPSSSSNTLDTQSPFHSEPKVLSGSSRSSQEASGTSQQPFPDQSHRTRPSEVISHKGQQSASGIQYPDGVIKKTWAYGHPRQGDDIKIEEVFQKADLELAVLSAFQVDPEWVQTKLDDKTKVIWVLQAKGQAEKDNIRSHAPSNYRFCFPSMEGNVNCMHSKLQLLAHPTHLRIVVPSANLVPYDWGESGVMENACFLIDLPRHYQGKTTEEGDLTLFATELIYFLEKMDLGEGTINSIRQFDFSRTAHLAFIHSIGGSHHGVAWKRTGLCGLGSAVRKLGLHTEKPLSADFLTASLGNINHSFMKSMYLALQGDSGIKEYTWRYSKPARGQGTTVLAPERNLLEDLKRACRIYFPTRETVESSRGGAGAGGTICFNPKWYNAEEFPRSLMRDCRSRRQGMLMHSKMIFVRPHGALSGGVAWAYLGSANLSESAWGRLVRDKSTKDPKLTCRNWECGVIVPIAAGDKAESHTEHQEPPGMEVFQGQVPVPMAVPGEEYGGRSPWYHNEQDRYSK